MKTKLWYAIIIACVAGMNCLAEDIATLDGKKYENVRDVAVKPDGLFFVAETEGSLKGVKVPWNNLPDATRQKYHYDPYEVALAFARQNQPVYLKKDLAFSLDQLETAKKKAQAEHKLLGFIMVWDNMFVPGNPMGGQGGNSCLSHFYVVFHDNLVLVFVRHESELGNVPDAVKKGFNGPDEGGFAPNMAVVTADCSQFVCEIPSGGEHSNGQIREQIFRQKIAVIKKFLESQETSKGQTK